MTTTLQQPTKIHELESIRGIAALLIVVHHIPSWNALFYDITIIKNASLMVELFFVLSGFVIFKAYSEKIKTGKDLIKFQFLRFGRLYPVHIIFLFALVLVEILRYVAVNKLGINSPNRIPFEENNWSAFFKQIFLVQAFWSNKEAITFNGPAWSISAEFYTYFIFGLIVLYLNKIKLFVFYSSAFLFLVLLVTIVPIDHNFFVRCLAGFFIGCCTASISEKINFRVHSSLISIPLAGILLFLQFKPANPHYDVTIYFLTSLLILSIVLSDGGIIKRVLNLRLLTWLGAISFSVYMSHSALLWVVNQTYRTVLKPHEAVIDGISTPQLSVIGAALAYMIFIGLVLLVSNYIYKNVEGPFREVSRKLVNKPNATVR
ncbi:acyltransferase family protein [Methylotenera versatilis]|uniref:Acyltransferase 3 n=1 Tax=Methylotenera versatilis (strain 301) TaxID=666681 RepID=D7DLF1_METV0|nr:acyltransferase [Methylotenera versatilis]ADI30622.1 acyltransferase 3 [Methylotenera versatilis 301]